MFKIAIPVLKTKNSKAAERFYCEDLGFEALNVFRPDPKASDPARLSLRHGEAHIHIDSFPLGGTTGSIVYIYLDNVDELHEQLVNRDVPIKMPPTDQTWGVRELHVTDPDGNELVFGQSL